MVAQYFTYAQNVVYIRAHVCLLGRLYRFDPLGGAASLRAQNQYNPLCIC